MVDRVAREAHDVRMDWVVTEARTIDARTMG
jgi:5-formyltetrahydrofolate cyclo-ligase